MGDEAIKKSLLNFEEQSFGIESPPEERTSSVKAEAEWKSSAVGTHGVSEYNAPRLDPSKQVEKAASQTNNYVVEGKNLEPKGSARAPLPLPETHKVVEEKIYGDAKVTITTTVKIEKASESEKRASKEMSSEPASTHSEVLNKVDDFAMTSPQSTLSFSKSDIVEAMKLKNEPEVRSFEYDSLEDLHPAVVKALTLFNKLSSEGVSYTANTTKLEATAERIAETRNRYSNQQIHIDDEELYGMIHRGRVFLATLDFLDAEIRRELDQSGFGGRFNTSNGQFLTSTNASLPEGRLELVDAGNSPRVAEKIKQIAERDITVEILIVDVDTFNELTEVLHESYESYVADLAQKLDVSNKDKAEKADREHEDFLKKSLQASYEQTMKSVEEVSGTTIWLEQLKVLFDEMMGRSEYNAYLSFIEAVKAFARNLKTAQDEKDTAKIEFFQEEIRRIIQQQSVRFDINIEEMIKKDVERKTL